MSKEKSYLSIQQVVDHGYCVGCGLCVAQASSGRMTDTEIGTYIPELSSLNESDLKNAENVCPFSKNGDQEDRLAKDALPSDLHYMDGLGFYDRTFIGYASEGDFRRQGSSAGLVNWLCASLLRKNLVDAVLHVKQGQPGEKAMYSYQLSRDEKSLQEGAKSKYYPIHLAHLPQLLNEMAEERIAVVGIPCFIKGLRALAKENDGVRKRLKYFVGIVCGHLKSKHFAEFLGWQAGIHPDNLELLDFRTKLKNRPASRYGYTAVPKSGESDTWVVKAMNDVKGGNWGHGAFKLQACEYCDDVMAETADIVFGDAWLPEFSNDSHGTNIIASRQPELTQLLLSSAEKGLIKIDEVSPERVLDSQRSGLNHRREGLNYRLARNAANGRPSPCKRRNAELNKVSAQRRTIYELREIIRETSHRAFVLAKEQNDLNIATSMLDAVTHAHDRYLQEQLKLSPVRKARMWLGKVRRVFKPSKIETLY